MNIIAKLCFTLLCLLLGVAEAAPYTVKTGDRLEKIATAHHTTWPQLMKLNQGKIKNPNLIYTEQVIEVPEISADTQPVVAKSTTAKKTRKAVVKAASKQPAPKARRVEQASQVCIDCDVDKRISEILPMSGSQTMLTLYQGTERVDTARQPTPEDIQALIEIKLALEEVAGPPHDAMPLAILIWKHRYTGIPEASVLVHTRFTSSKIPIAHRSFTKENTDAPYP